MLDAFGHAPRQLFGTLRQFPKKMWLYKPSPERWSIHEIIHHLADSEAHSYVCVRRFIAEPGSAVFRMDAERWAGSLGYFHQSTREALEIVRRLRRMTHQVLMALPEAVWLQTVEHPREGRISLERWIERQAQHIPHHAEQMRTNFDLWLKTHPPRRPATRRPIPEFDLAKADGKLESTARISVGRSA
jgi:DinB superfamily